jgi:hypothetical protein
MARNNKNSWECKLTAFPDRVGKHERVDLTVTLSVVVDGKKYDIPDDETYKEFYNSLVYKYTDHNPTLNLALSEQVILDNEHNNHAELTDLPELLDDSYEIDVNVKMKSGGGGFVPSLLLTSLATSLDVTGTIDFPREGVPGKTTIHVTSLQKKVDVTLQRTFAGPTDDRALWPAIRNRTAAIGFDRYKTFINCVFCETFPADPITNVLSKTRSQIPGHCLDDPKSQQLSIYGPYAYGVLKLATQVFLTLESGVVIRDTDRKPKIFDIEKEKIRVNDFSLTVPKLKEELRKYLAPTDGNLPYLDRIVTNLITLDPDNPDKEVLPYCLGVLEFRLTSPSLIELIWSYWLEEGMLVQTMNAIARRFQNRRGSPNDPLGELEFDPLRPLNNLIWGFIQDEYTRLTVPRRAHEYMHHYGLSLMGKAVPDLNPADSRSKFIEAFHNLLSAAARFYKEDSDTTVIADAFPLLNALKEVHLILAEGAHNQFGDLTWTARAEMLTIQWMLARPEMKEFLRGRYMVPYQEEWMGAVDSMKKLQGWTDTTITHFYELAVMGERILLSVRYGDWSDIENIEDQAKNWARSNKPEIQIYIHGYRAVTGVDLAAEVTDSRDAATRFLQPSALLQRRLAEQMSAMPLRGPSGPDLVAARVSGQAALPRPGRPKLPAYRKGS